LVATPLHDPSPTLDASYHKGAGERNGIERQIVTVAFTQNTRDEVRLINGDGQIAGALAAQPGMKQTTYVSETARSLTARHDGSPCDDRGPNIVATPIAFQSSQSGVRAGELHATLDSNNGSRRHNGVISQSTVRRLTPRECERLQGFPDDWTLIELPLKSRQTRVRWAADAPRYKALGNSMAVPVMKYILDRIKLVNERT
jgi:DNA (cytosine-5)-methyltransferase 1